MKNILTAVFTIIILSGCQTASFNPNPALFQKDNGVAFQVSSHHPTEGDAWTIKPGETKVLMDEKGPAIIRNIWFTLGGGPNADHGVDLLRKLTIRMYWDDEASPSVEAPFGDFFGDGFGIYKPFHSQLIGITDKGYFSYFPMPFRKRGKIEVTNTSKYPIIIFFHFLGAKYDKLPDNTLYFHAQWRRENPPTIGKNYTILNAEGKGYYAGCFMFMQGYTTEDKLNFLEGDEWIYVDNATNAVIKGTGGEDYFQGAWYFSGGTFNAPYHGLIMMDHKNKQVGCYRFHILDRINFEKSISVEFEHGQRIFNEAKADFASTAFWYQNEPHKPFAPISNDREPTKVIPGFVLPGAVEFEGLAGTHPYYVCTYNGGWSRDMAALIFFAKTNDFVEKEFNVEKNGKYSIGVNYILNDHNGIFIVEIDGKKIGDQIDGYSDDPMDAYLLCRNKAAGLKHLDEMALSKGKHKIKIISVGKNIKSKGYKAIVDCVTVALLQ
ncbi:MAG: hypothetical protein DRI44_01885 [Chlamydiae bacterium]|nr:MAG: hypothetical protein DRI44_01885 [Chlamydiota bacterium]